MEVSRGVHTGAWRCTEWHAEMARCVQRYVEGCADVFGGMERGVQMCVEVHRGTHRCVWWCTGGCVEVCRGCMEMCKDTRRCTKGLGKNHNFMIIRLVSANDLIGFSGDP